MQTMSAQSYDNDGAAMGSATDADLEDLERNLAKAGRNNNIKVPKGFTMDNMEAFEELGFTLSGPGAISKKKNIARRGEDGDDSGGSPGSEGKGSTRSTTMNLLQTYRKYNPPPTIVPPSPGRRDIITDDVRNSHSRMQRALESWEERSADRMIGDNPFGGKMGVLGVEDFQSPEGLVIEVAGAIEGQVEEEGGAEEVGVEADGEQ